MLVYTVSWSHSSELSKGKGRVCKNDSIFGFSVLCRSSSDAVKCLEWYFVNVFKNPKGLDFTDGIVKLQRSSVDSRNFTINYLFMDDIKRPISLSNVKDSLTDIMYKLN